MYHITTLLFFVALAEFLRRCCLTLIVAFTGPLARIPGPLLFKLSDIPWKVHSIRGTKMNVAPELFKKYGPVVRVKPNHVIFAEKEAIQKILVEEDYLKAPSYNKLSENSHVTNLLSERDKVKYKQARRLLSPGFAIGYLNGLEPLFQDCVQALDRSLNAKCINSTDFTTIDVDRMLGNFGVDVMSASLFGGSFNLVESDDQAVKTMFVRRLKSAAIRHSIPFSRHLPFMPPDGIKEMDDLLNKVLAKRRRDIAEKGEEVKRDLFQIFMENHTDHPKEFTELHVKSSMVLFMIAGSDTTSYTATCCLVLLMNNPDKLKLLLKEIDQAFPFKDDEITFAKTQDLPFLNGVIYEALRLMPVVVSGLDRVITGAPATLSNYEIPVGTEIAAWVNTLMQDPAHWPSPTSFIPERWAGGDVDRKAFLPFSGGTRNCPGQQFSMRELRLVLATLLRNFEMRKIEGQSLEQRIHTVPWFVQGGYWVGFRPREK